ncbi:hypothetical protein RJ639_001306 [Escallonia herrerae]|uniref:RNA helicase n=1 Tax=Escallonia herrerae TaxID=1293975 RepID=A0AA88X8U9_9ASTE|nr:hypothetical protein RJ639_001306 [Escallonia herrerae]
MGSVAGEECSVIGDKEDIGFIDYENDNSICNHNIHAEGPVIVSNPFPFEGGKPRFGVKGETVVEPITIENTTADPVELWSVQLYDPKPEGSFTLSVMKPPSPDSDVEYIRSFLELSSLEDRVLRPCETITIWLLCKPTELGMHRTAIHFTIGDERLERVALLIAEDKISQSMASDKPYYRRRNKQQLVLDTCTPDVFVRGSRPAKTYNRSFKYWLSEYPITRDIRELIENKQAPDAIIEGLTKRSYVSYFTTLVNMEEIKLEEDMRSYDMECVYMRSKGQFLTLEVPGLAEKRPSLVCRDHIFAKLANEDDSDIRPFQGFIHRVEADEICLKFDRQFHARHRTDNLYNVQFTYNRLNMRRMYQAIEAAGRLETEFLFPFECFKRRKIQPIQVVPISRMLNEEQMRSVEMILGCKGGPPYVIHGPPGTGKTVTMVEAVLQLYSTRSNARILVCTPSNSAADHLLEKLLSEKAVNVEKKDILRLNAVTRALEDMKPEYVDFCYVVDSMFQSPRLRDLMRYRIIISTYTSSSVLYAEGIKRGHFSHIFMDEAGQASEPETMIPLSQLCRGDTIVVLAGDPMQLGPVIYSTGAEHYGLGKSYLERLFDCKFYDKGDENYVTKLVRSYRCHPEILHLPSELFYQGELISCKKDDDRSSSMTSIDLLPNKDFPVLFIGIQGCDQREGSNPSWFNRIEASKVVEILRNLIENHGFREEDIGVITPYRQQVLKIQKALENFEWSDITVGSVEQFQGQEREVIIISTVRSTVKHNNFDRNHCLGFLSNYRRFNVAITRAKSLLIVVGNPHIICQDLYWNKLLWRCVDNNSYKGCFLPNRQEVSEEEASQDAYLDYAGEASFSSSHATEWGQVGNQIEESQNPVTDTEWGQVAYQFEDTQNPVKDEAEWSDGWK